MHGAARHTANLQRFSFLASLPQSIRACQTFALRMPLSITYSALNLQVSWWLHFLRQLTVYHLQPARLFNFCTASIFPELTIDPTTTTCFTGQRCANFHRISAGSLDKNPRASARRCPAITVDRPFLAWRMSSASRHPPPCRLRPVDGVCSTPGRTTDQHRPSRARRDERTVALHFTTYV